MLEKFKTNLEEQKILLQLARESINYGVLHQTMLKISLEQYPEHLRENLACFVTLEKNKELRGCIGTLVARSPLVQEVVTSAFSAAFLDRRFLPVTQQEIPALQIHISILTPAVRMSFTSEADLLTKLQPGIDGLILKVGNSSGTFLPSVWEQIPERQAFLQHLKNKAGLPMDYWSNQVEIFRYETEMFGED